MHRSDWFSVGHLQWARLWLLVGMLIITMIFYTSLTSSKLQVPHFRHVDKVLHFGVYALLMGWFVQIFHNRTGRLFVAMAFVLMGVMIEFLQAMSPIRHFDVLDMMANFTGVAIAWLAGFTWLDSILVWVEKTWLNLAKKTPSTPTT